MKTRHSIQKKSSEKKARRAARKRGREGEDEMDPFLLAGRDYSPSKLGDVERKKRTRKMLTQKKKRQ